MSEHKYTIDLHTHSTSSHDGGLREEDYIKIIDGKLLDYIAITDHNDITFASRLKQKLGNNIIVGEEIMSQQGEIIGLFLEKTVLPHMTVEQTFYDIHNQGGLVYIPHPLEVFRKGLSREDIVDHITDIDIIEVFNARAWGRGNAIQAQNLAEQYKKPGAASSDAHTLLGVGTAFSVVDRRVTRENLAELLSNCSLQRNYAPFFSYLAPFYNRLKKKL